MSAGAYLRDTQACRTSTSGFTECQRAWHLWLQHFPGVAARAASVALRKALTVGKERAHVVLLALVPGK